MRGRPAGRMTPKKVRALAVLREKAEDGRAITYAEVARRIGVHSYRDARRIIKELRAMGHEIAI